MKDHEAAACRELEAHGSWHRCVCSRRIIEYSINEVGKPRA